MARIDYWEGDEIVCIQLPVTGRPSILKVNHIYICEGFADGDKIAAKYGDVYCPFCKTQAAIDLVVYLQNYPHCACPCWFRKKLDFKKLCNVDETIKEDA